MQKRRKILSLGVCATALAVALVGGTMAFQTDSASDVNVMTTGNVKIAQNEQQRVEAGNEFASELEPFEQGKILMPVTYPGDRTADTVTIGEHTIELSDDEANYVDKIISVTNTGSEAAYVRTLVAVPTGGSDWESEPVAANNCWLHWNIPADYATYWTLVSSNVPMIEIDGENYYVWEFVHEEAVAKGETTYPMVRGFYMDQRVDSDDQGYFITYADGATKRIEDVSFGDTVNVIAISQAVQAAGFTNAATALDEGFGKVAENAAKWFGAEEVEVPVLVSTADELQAALNNEDSVVLTADIDMSGKRVDIPVNDVALIDLNGHTLTSKDGGGSNTMAVYVNEGATLTLKDSAGDGKIVSSCYGVYVKSNATFTMDGGEIVVQGNGRYDHGVVVWNGATFVMNGGKITASADVFAAYHDSFASSSTKQPTVVINGGELAKEKEDKDEGEPAYIDTDCTPNVTINGGTFDGKEFSGNVSDYYTAE